MEKWKMSSRTVLILVAVVLATVIAAAWILLMLHLGMFFVPVSGHLPFVN
jgi:hypothetical protein